MIAFPSAVALVALGLALAIAGALVWVAPIWAFRRTRWSPAVQATGVSTFHGPVLAAILCLGAVLLDGWFWEANPGTLPSLLDPAGVGVIAGLVIVWAIVGTAAFAVRRHVISDQARTGRLLQYGILGAGLLAMVLVLLSSPEVPHVEAGIWAVIGFGAGLLVTYLAVNVANLIAERYFAILLRQRPNLETIYRFLRRAMIGVIALIGVAVSTYTNFPGTATAVTSLLLAAGFLSIVVGLAAQSTLSNVIAGAMLSLAQPLQIGDAVVFSGDWCFVEDIRLTYTVLRTWDLRRLMVPNSMFQSNVLINYTAVDPTMLVIVYLRVTYDANIDRAREIMVEEARRHPDFKPLGNLPITHVMEYQESGVQVRLLSAARDQPTAFQVEKDLLYSIRQRFDAAGIESYPARRLIVEGTDPPRPVRRPDPDRGPG